MSKKNPWDSREYRAEMRKANLAIFFNLVTGMFIFFNLLRVEAGALYILASLASFAVYTRLVYALGIETGKETLPDETP